MTTATHSRIDIVCPTYNRAALVRGAVETVLAQTVTRWRLIVVSDASTDDTEDVVRSFADPRISFIKCASG